MCVIMRKTRVLLLLAVYAAQIIQILCAQDDNGVGGSGTSEIFKVYEYSSLMEKGELSQGKVHCDFEGHWCGFHNQKKEDDFDWTLTNKKTPTADTGPDHDISGTGSFIYIEASKPRRVGDVARLTSPVLPPMVYCLRFGYHAWGEELGHLKVYKRSIDGKRERILSLDKNYGKKWQVVLATVVRNSQFQIDFDGVRGKGFTGDIALDNITLTEGACSIFRGNDEDLCDPCYPGITNTFPGFPAYHAWPWLRWLSSDAASQPVLCPGVQVLSDWLLTTPECARKFQNVEATTVSVRKIKRRDVRNATQGRFSQSLQPVLLKLNSSTLRGKARKVCLPSSVPLQSRVANCYLLGLSTLDNPKSFAEFSATILASQECEREIPNNKLDLGTQLCVQINASSDINLSQFQYGFVACKNEILKRWILQAMDSFAYSYVKRNMLVLRRVSSDVEWIENITKSSLPTPDVPLPPIPPKDPITQGFQIMEKSRDHCLTFQSNKFLFRSCNDLDMAQRFEWTVGHQIVSLAANACIESDGTHFHFLRKLRCAPNRRSQKWICKGYTLMNPFYARFIASKSAERYGFAQLTREPAYVGEFVIAGTHENLCALRPTVKGVMTCDFNVDRACGFDGVDSWAQFMWRVARTGSTDFMQFPSLVATDKFFRVLRRTYRGPPVAVLRSPSFHGQHCAQFRVFFQGSPLNQLKVYKDGGGEGKMMFQRHATSDNFWRLHRVAVVPTACEAFQVVFKVVFSAFKKSKVAIRDIIISPGTCGTRNIDKGGNCLKGWKLVNGQCLYYHDTKATWYEASAVCHIADAELVTHAAASEIISRGRRAWFGVRSCPTGKMYSVRGVPYSNDTRLFPTPACRLFKKPHYGAAVYETVPCDLKLPFACEKDPGIPRSTCGWRNDSADGDRQWPWHVMIIVENRCVCGGTLIAPGYVVTNTQCLSRVWKWKVKLFIPSSRTIISKVTQITHHSMLLPKSGENDISVVTFKDNPLLYFSCRMQISPYWTDDRENFLKDKRCVVLGWGTFHGSLRKCSSLNYKAHEVEVVSRDTCRDYYGGYMITERMICAKARNETTRHCLGDTGGPLVCDIAGAWTLVGVTSWGIGCSPTRKYGIYADVGSMRPWLDILARENVKS